MIPETRKAELIRIAQERRQNLHDTPSPELVVWMNHEETVFFHEQSTRLERRDASKVREGLERKAADTRAALREELNEHPLLSEVTAKAEATQADILREAVNLYKRLSPGKSAVLAAYLDKGSITGAVEVTGFSRGKVHKLLLEIEQEQGVQVITRRRGLDGEHIGDSYRHNGRTRNRTHRAG